MPVGMFAFMGVFVRTIVAVGVAMITVVMMVVIGDRDRGRSWNIRRLCTWGTPEMLFEAGYQLLISDAIPVAGGLCLRFAELQLV